MDYGDEILCSYQGIGDDSLQIEVLTSKEWLESLTGKEVRCFAYPSHDHDRRTMGAVEISGHIIARSGVPSGIEPWSVFLLGHQSSPAWQTTWEAASLYEMPLTILCSDLQSKDISDIEAWVLHEDNLPTWKASKTWVQMYTHTTPEDSLITSTATLDADHLWEFLRVIDNDGEVWINSMGTIAEYYRNYHYPSPEEEFIWIINEATDVPDGDGNRSFDPDNPWNGHKCAFTFSTDDGWKSNLTEFLPVFEQLGKPYTAFLNPLKILNPWIAYMNETEAIEFSQAEMVEIANHSFSHKILLPDEIGTYSGSGQIKINTTSVEGEEVKQLTLVLVR